MKRWREIHLVVKVDLDEEDDLIDSLIVFLDRHDIESSGAIGSVPADWMNEEIPDP